MVKLKEKGVTLVALSVTIIVLLILAGTSIAILTGDDGNIKQAQEGKRLTEISEERQAIDLAIVDAIKSDNNAELTKESEENFKKALNKQIGEGTYEIKYNETNNTFEITFKESQRTYIVDEDGNLQE